MFNERMSVLFKKLRVVRMVDRKRNVLVYLTYSDKLIDGSPQKQRDRRAAGPGRFTGQVSRAGRAPFLALFGPGLAGWDSAARFARNP